MLSEISDILRQPPWWLSSVFTALLGAVVPIASWKSLPRSRIVEDYRKEHEDRMRRAKGEVS